MVISEQRASAARQTRVLGYHRQMIRPRLALLLLAVFLYSCGNQQDSESKRLPTLESGLKVTTWNLQWFPGKRPGNSVPAAEQEAHIAAVSEVLAELDPDILCVQEIKDPKALLKLAAAMPDHSIQVVSSFKGAQEVASTGDNADTDDDGDGFSDDDETNIYGTNPKRADSDGDGLTLQSARTSLCREAWVLLQ